MLNLKNNSNILYLPIGVPTFHLESAQIQFEKSINLLKSLKEDILYPEKMLLTIPDLKEFIKNLSPDFIIVQNITFANSAYISEILKNFDCPILLWTLREPIVDGGRLRLNSLTGAYSAGNALMSFRNSNFEYIFGSPDEEKVKNKIKCCIKVINLMKELKNLKIVSIGHTPEGFGFGRALDTDILKTFGVTLNSIEARELIDNARKFTEEECKQYIDELEENTIGLKNIPKNNITDFARLSKAYKEYVINNNVGAISSRCWPDFFTEFGTPVCSVLSILNDIGIVASCEADTYGALSMYVGMKLTNRQVFLGDPVSLNEEENTITYWHCGTAACSLANSDTKACIGVHPNRKIGPVMDFGCKPNKEVTIFRIGRKPNGKFRFFVSIGEALDKPKQFTGTSIVVKTNNNAYNIVNNSILDGWEPHFVVVYGNIKQEILILAKILELDVMEY